MKRIWLFGLVSIIITALFIGHNISTQYHATLDEARSDTDRFVQFLALDAERTFYGTEQMFDGIANVLSAAPNRPAAHAPKIRSMLLELKQNNPFLMDLLILDSKGDIVHWTGPGAPPEVRDRAYAAVHLQAPHEQLFIGKPQLSRVHQDQWFFGNSRALRNPDGALKYILVAITDLGDFAKRYLQLQLPDGASVALFSNEGHIYARLPDHSSYVGRSIELPTELLAGFKEATFLRISSPLDQQRRLASFRRVSGTPLIAAVTYHEETVLAPWRTYALFVGAFGMVVVAALTVMTWITARYQSKQQQLKELFRTQAITDPLTGVANRRHALEMCKHEVQRTCRYKSQLSLVLIDIDHFKQINDQHGHDVGDAVLKQFARLLNEVCRQSDLVSRIGGEEFLLVLPDTAYIGAQALAEKVRSTIASNLFRINGGTMRVQASLGVAALQEEERDIDAAFRRADKALYRAKQNGRNRVA